MKQRLFSIALLLFSAVLFAGSASAQESLVQQSTATAKALSDSLEALIADPSAEFDQFTSIKRGAHFSRQSLLEEKERLEQLATTLEQDLALLGDALPTDVKTLKQERKRLKIEIETVSRERAVLNTLFLRYDQLIDLATEQAQIKLSQRLLAQSDTVVSAAYASLSEPRGMVESATTMLVGGTGWASFGFWHLLLVSVLLLAGSWLSWRQQAVSTQALAQVSAMTSLRIAAMCALRRRGPLITALLLGSLYLAWVPNTPDEPIVVRLLLAMAGYALLAGVIAILLAPCAQAHFFLPINEDLSHRLARRLRLLVLLSLSAWVVFGATLFSALPMPHQLLIRALFASLWLVNGLLVVWFIGRIHDNHRFLLIRLLYSLALIAAYVAELMGYRVLAEYMALGLLGSYVFVALGLFGNWLLGSWLDAVDDGTWKHGRDLRLKVGLAENAPLPGMIWLRLGSTLLLWLGIIYLMAATWGVAAVGTEKARLFLTEGFGVGSVNIIPSNLLVAIVVFALAWQVAIWVKQSVIPRWLRRTQLDRGARDAIVTLSGYVGVIVAVLLGLTFAGLDFGKLALIAGALSVGIGFGLQNIVNNFVSGLILLFERPIRVGDWIVIGGTEGYVRRISIRSTQIETFDRADIIVPNSDLISNNVTNWMLRDPYGRVVVPVGVAYGSDTEQVKQLLLDVAASHPLVMMGDARVNNPRVLFRSFGDSSLNFELRCFISDVESRMSTQSDLNFAIDRSFREHGIQIPFPQRDVHLVPQPGDAG